MLDLVLLPGDYAVCRLDPDAKASAAVVERLIQPRPTAASPLGEAVSSPGVVLSVTWTPTEISIICTADLAPAGLGTVNVPWRCLRVTGPIHLALTGILASLVDPLAEALVNVFAFSTYDTDYLLVPAVRLDEALAALTAAGHRIDSSAAR